MKFRSNAVIRTLASLIALVFCVASSAFATPLYTVAWYANPAVTNVAYAAASVSANDADSPRLSAALAAAAIAPGEVVILRLEKR